jgi:hypothetical protein
MPLVAMATRADTDDPRWLVLIHQIPPKPAYFRQKVGRRLQRLGAVAIKNSVYVLPSTDSTLEDFQWVAREIASDGGEATVCRATFVEGLRDDQIEALFHAAREADYAQVAEEARERVSDLPPRVASDDERRPQLEADVARLRKRISEILAIDFFGAPGREAAESALASFERRLQRKEKPAASAGDEGLATEHYRGRVWVTRKNVHVDRIASAWLIRRFIDPDARFKFVPGQGYRAVEGEVTFDMFEADFTHVGDACTFETLVDRFELKEAGLSAIAEIVHDIDVKDGKFARTEAPGVAASIAGIALAEREDEARIELGGRLFGALLELYRRRRA